MFRRLLVALDGTTQAAAALPLARTLATVTDAEMLLLRVTPVATTSTPHQLAAEATHYLNGLALELSGAGLRVTARVREGDPLSEILTEVQSAMADLLVLAARRAAERDEGPLSGLPEALVEQCPVPVLTVNSGAQPIERIRRLLVPTRGHPGGTIALGAAVRLAQATGAEITLLDVIGSVPAYMYEGGLLASSIDPEWELASRTSAQAYLDEIAGRLRAAGIGAEGQVRIGTVPDTLLETADEVGADSIVIAAHAHEPPPPTPPVSLASRLLRIARQPVLVIRHGVRDESSQEVGHDRTLTGTTS